MRPHGPLHGDPLAVGLIPASVGHAVTERCGSVYASPACRASEAFKGWRLQGAWLGIVFP